MQDEIGRACSAYKEEEECLEDFGEKLRSKETTRKT
jgi:hypothetical protein